MKKYFKLLYLLLIFGSHPSLSGAQIISTVAGNGTPGYFGDGGLATAAELQDCTFVIFDTAGNFYITDEQNHRIRKVTVTTGIITTVAGNGTGGFSGDGGLATLASLNFPLQIAISPAGDIYIADSFNCCIRKVNAATGIITTVAGTNTCGSSGDGGLAIVSDIGIPNGLALDTAGNFFFSDRDNYLIRKVDGVTGIITTVAGNGAVGFSGDGGPATSASFNDECYLAFDSGGNLYISDEINNRIRKVNKTTGIVSTVAGSAIQGFAGDGGPATSAELYYPTGLVFDSLGNLYLGDEYNQRVRVVNAVNGVITTVAGNGASGFNGDGILATLASFWFPCGLAFNPQGNLFIADAANNRIREVGLGILTPTKTNTPTITSTPIFTNTLTGTPTFTMTYTHSSTQTPTFSQTLTPTSTPTPAFIATSTATLTSTPSPTSTINLTPTPVCQIHIWPDPFNPNYASLGKLKVGCLPVGATVSFYTVAGELVRAVSENGGLALWDGRNQLGGLVSPGVYYYVIQQGTQVLGTGKFLVINNH